MNTRTEPACLPNTARAARGWGRTNHAVCFFELLGGQKDGGYDGSGLSKARLAILPGVTHSQIFASPASDATVTPFLDAK